MYLTSNVAVYLLPRVGNLGLAVGGDVILGGRDKYGV